MNYKLFHLNEWKFFATKEEAYEYCKEYSLCFCIVQTINDNEKK